MTARLWRAAWQQALYGPGGFYLRELPSDHFRTASQAGADLVAQALLGLIERYSLRRVLEVGAGTGRLLRAMAALAPGLDLAAVELRPRPAGLPSGIGWWDAVPPLDDTPTLLLGWELLDVVPLTVAELVGREWRTVLVDAPAGEAVGPVVTAAEADWIARWCAPGSDRVEIGLARDEFWSGLVGRLPRGLALAVDYGFASGHEDPLPPTLTGFRAGRAVPPIPDGSCDLTAHVRFDSLAAALARRPGTTSRLVAQAQAMVEFGRSVPPPDPGAASRDPLGYLTALEVRGRYRELTDPDGLGGFGWLLTAVG